MDNGGVRRVELVIDHEVRELCRKSYPGHPRGCPNFGRRAECPPAARPIEYLMDLRKPVFAAWNCFDLTTHVRRMREHHPSWSERQVYCCLYWQRKAKKALQDRVESFAGERLKYPCKLFALYTPEAHGVNVTATMKQIGRILEWPPRRIAYQVAIVGAPRI